MCICGVLYHKKHSVRAVGVPYFRTDPLVPNSLSLSSHSLSRLLHTCLSKGSTLRLPRAVLFSKRENSKLVRRARREEEQKKKRKQKPGVVEESSLRGIIRSRFLHSRPFYACCVAYPLSARISCQEKLGLVSAHFAATVVEGRYSSAAGRCHVDASLLSLAHPSRSSPARFAPPSINTGKVC